MAGEAGAVGGVWAYYYLSMPKIDWLTISDSQHFRETWHAVDKRPTMYPVVDVNDTTIRR